MTNDLEKQFFDTFGIEPNKEYYCPNCDTKLEKWNTPKGMQYICGNDTECDYFLDSYDKEFKDILNNLGFRVAYPQITDRILLELICFIEQIDLGRYGEYEYFCKFNYKDLRTEILAKSMRLAHKKAHSEVNGQLFYNQVRTLFEEG